MYKNKEALLENTRNFLKLNNWYFATNSLDGYDIYTKYFNKKKVKVYLCNDVENIHFESQIEGLIKELSHFEKISVKDIEKEIFNVATIDNQFIFDILGEDVSNILSVIEEALNNKNNVKNNVDNKKEVKKEYTPLSILDIISSLEKKSTNKEDSVYSDKEFVNITNLPSIYIKALWFDGADLYSIKDNDISNTSILKSSARNPINSTLIIRKPNIYGHRVDEDVNKVNSFLKKAFETGSQIYTKKSALDKVLKRQILSDKSIYNSMILYHNRLFLDLLDVNHNSTLLQLILIENNNIESNIYLQKDGYIVDIVDYEKIKDNYEKTYNSFVTYLLETVK